jgi:hypothetical protein
VGPSWGGTGNFDDDADTVCGLLQRIQWPATVYAAAAPCHHAVHYLSRYLRELGLECRGPITSGRQDMYGVRRPALLFEITSFKPLPTGARRRDSKRAVILPLLSHHLLQSMY